jgi:nucleotide-binding universal stress UspA family protein
MSVRRGCDTDGAVRALRGRLTDVAPGAASWPVRLAVGNPVPVIVDEAHARGVGLVIMGLRQHPRVDRVMRDETTLQVIHAAEVPVLGVTAWLHHVPRRVVVGVDFGGGSSRAAALACRFVAGGGTLTLAYVDTPRPSGASEGGEGAAIIHELGIEGAFGRLGDSLPLLPGARVETATLSGSPADALLEYVDHVSADLIVMGRHRQAPIRRAWPGRVTTAIVRDGRCSVLVVPG